MDDSKSMLNKTMASTGPVHKVPCECVSVCICESKNVAPDVPGPDNHCLSGSDDHCVPPDTYGICPSGPGDHCASKMATTDVNESNDLPKTPYVSNKDTLHEPDPDNCHVCALQRDRTNAPNSCKWGLAEDGVSAWASKKSLDSYAFASCLFDHCCSILKVRHKGRVQDLIIENYAQTLEIYLKVYSTDKHLSKEDFIEMTNILKTFKEKGLVTDIIISNFNRAIKENGYIVSEVDELSSNISEMNINTLRYINTAANKFYCSSYKEVVGNMKTEENREKYPDLIFAKFMEPNDKGDDNQSRINLLNSLDFLVVMCDIEFLHQEGWLCKCDMSKFLEVDKLASALIEEKAVIVNQMENFVKRIVDGLKITPGGYINYDVEYRELPMESVNWSLIGKRVCITGNRGHNTPLCKICGVQSSWLNTFKKRSIRIKEADSCNNKTHLVQ